MKKRLVFLLVGIMALNSMSFIYAKRIKGNGTVVTKEIAVSNFENVVIGSGIDCSKRFFDKQSYKNPVFNYTQTSASSSLSITIDENLIPYLDINSDGRELSIKTEKGVTINPSRLEINGSSKGLKKLIVSGCIDFTTMNSFSSDEFELNTSGACDVKMSYPTKIKEFVIRISGAGDLFLEDLTCEKIESNVSGAGDITLKGKSDEAKFRVSGAGDIKAFDFIVKNILCTVSGIGDVKVTATETLEASVSGTGDIHYRGNAKANTRVSGLGDIRKVND